MVFKTAAKMKMKKTARLFVMNPNFHALLLIQLTTLQYTASIRNTFVMARKTAQMLRTN